MRRLQPHTLLRRLMSGCNVLVAAGRGLLTSLATATASLAVHGGGVHNLLLLLEQHGQDLDGRVQTKSLSALPPLEARESDTRLCDRMSQQDGKARAAVKKSMGKLSCRRGGTRDKKETKGEHDIPHTAS